MDQYYHDKTDLFLKFALSEQTQFVALPRANNNGGAGSSDRCGGGKEVSDTVVVEKGDKENWDLDKVMTATEAAERSLKMTICELETDWLAVHTEVHAGLVEEDKWLNVVLC